MTLRAQVQAGPRLPAEFALAVACGRWAFSGDGADEVRRLAEAAEWGEFLRVCRRHRVQGLAWHALCGVGVALPPAADIALGGDARSIADHGLRVARESARLAESFTQAGLRLLFLKGLTVASLAYGNPFLKMGWDIDLLVLPADVAASANRLGTLGYRLHIPENPSSLLRWHGFRKESIWRGSDGLVVELHSRVADQLELLPTIDAESSSRFINVAPEIDLPTLAEEELFAYLGVHGASSAWFRLKWITDFTALLHDEDPVRVEQLYDRSQQLGAGRSTAQALLVAERLYGIQLSPTLSAKLNTRMNRLLARAALSEMLRDEPTTRPLGTAVIHLSQFLLKGGAGFKFAELSRQLRVATGLY